MSKNIFFLLIIAGLLFPSCKRKQHIPVYDRSMNDSTVVRIQNSSIENKLDSIGFIEFISKQKLQDVYDLISWNNRKDVPNFSDKNFKDQLKSYFIHNDTLQIFNIKNELDSAKVYFVKVNKIEVLQKDSLDLDSIQRVNYELYYFGKNKEFLQSAEKSAQFILSKPDGKNNNKFTFYFSGISEKDTIRKGVTQ